MKLTVCLLVVLAAIVMVKAEECRDVGDCQHVTCPEQDYEKECHNRQCTCTHKTAGCSSQGDCNDPRCNHDAHCIDGRCRCGFGFGGNGGPGGPVGR